MAKKKDEIKSVAGLVFKSIWLVIALVFFFAGMTMFTGDKTFEGWLMWGLFCLFPMLGAVIRDAFVSGKRGARRGANMYTATVDSTSVTVSNHPFREALIEIAGTIIAAVLIGPLTLGVKILFAVIAIIKFVKVLIDRKKEAKQQEN